MTKNYAPKSTNAQGRLVQVNNIEIYYEEYGEGHPLILLHGFGGCTQNWYPFKDDLSKAYRLIIIDLRGHGYSTNPENKFTHREAANDVFQLLEIIGIKQFSAIGMSTGGMVLLHMATLMPSCIDAMVLVSATTHFPQQAKAIMHRASFETMPEEVRAMYRECAKHGDEQIRKLISQFNAFHENDEDMNFTEQNLATITARTLIIHGDRDNFFPVEIAKNLAHWIPLSELWIISNGDHVPVYDSTVPFTTTALRFLEEGRIKS